MIFNKRFLKFLPFLLLPALVFLAFGNTRWAILSTGLAPLYLICSDLSMLFFSSQGKRYREILHHLTDEERRQCEKMAGAYGMKVGLIGGITGAPLAILFSFGGYRDYAFLVWGFLMGLLLIELFAVHHQRSMFRFAFSTKYGKEKGWDKDVPNQ